MSIRSSLLKYLGGVPQEIYHVDVANLQDKIASLFSDLDDLKGTVKNVEHDKSCSASIGASAPELLRATD